MPPSTMRWDSLAMNLQGTLMLPGAPHYERSRRVWNGMIDRRPAAIAVCANRADVAATLRFAAEAGAQGHGARRWSQRRRPADSGS